MTFYQEPPELNNFYVTHPLLHNYLKLYLPSEDFEEIDTDLERFGQRVLDEVEPAGQHAMQYEPELEQFDAWGNRVDTIKVSQGWDDLKDIAAEEGLIAIGYERDYGYRSRMYQMAKLLLYTPSSAIYTCPLAMADGAARLIETLAPEQLQMSYKHLTSRDPSEFWVAGQWMTEREGGSDVGRTSTLAHHDHDRTYHLSGDKWFTSAATAEMAMTLARIEEDGETTDGNRGLSLFYLRVYEDDGSRNGIRINKLKDKLGTKALPTTELTMDQCKAQQIGQPGRGVKHITTILNITRIYNAMSCVAYMGRGLALAKDYSSKREAFGKSLQDLPLHQAVLAEFEIEYTMAFLLVFHVIKLQGKLEVNEASEEEERILRLLTPVAKLWTGKRAIAMISEVVESIGGMGYIEETGIPVLLRDAQVFSIWEGTTNVLSLDTLRAIHKEKGLMPLLEQISSFLPSSSLDASPVKEALQKIKRYASKIEKQDREVTEFGGRIFSYGIARLTSAYLALKFHHDLMENDPENSLLNKLELIYKHWCRNELSQLRKLDDISKEHLDQVQSIL